MTETPTEETAAKNRSGGVHLPKLPEGWHYQVVLLGPLGQAVDVRPMGPQDYDPPTGNGKVGPEYKLVVNTGDRRGQRQVEAENLGEALRLGAQTVRTLRDLAAHEAKANQAREKLLAGIGQPSPRGEDGTLDTPSSLSVNIVDRDEEEPPRRRPMQQGGSPRSAEPVDAEA